MARRVSPYLEKTWQIAVKSVSLLFEDEMMNRRPAILLLLLACLALGRTEAAAQSDTVRLVFIGDVMSHGPQVTAALMPGGNRSDPASFDYSAYFRHVKNRFDAADFVVANMEFPCGVAPYTGYPQFSAPRSLAEEARRAGVDLFLTANNHICDKSGAGIDSTYVIYTRMDVPFTGIYRSEGEEYLKNPLIVDIKGVRVAFINFTYGTNGLPVPRPWRVSGMDSVRVKDAVRRARERNAALIIALPHWGQEYHLEPSAQQKEWAEMLFRNGVDAVIGAHPHVVQPARFDPPHAIAYSLGNFVSNQSDPFTQIGMLYELVVVGDGRGNAAIVDAFPTYLWCSRHGMYERNYTVFPILEWIGTRESWIDKREYDKMVREWEALNQKYAH